MVAKSTLSLSACLDTTIPFRSPIQMALFLPFQNGKNSLFTVETVAERNGLIIAKQALSVLGYRSTFVTLETSLPNPLNSPKGGIGSVPINQYLPSLDEPLYGLTHLPMYCTRV